MISYHSTNIVVWLCRILAIKKRRDYLKKQKLKFIIRYAYKLDSVGIFQNPSWKK